MKLTKNLFQCVMKILFCRQANFCRCQVTEIFLLTQELSETAEIFLTARRRIKFSWLRSIVRVMMFARCLSMSATLRTEFLSMPSIRKTKRNSSQSFAAEFRSNFNRLKEFYCCTFLRNKIMTDAQEFCCIRQVCRQNMELATWARRRLSLSTTSKRRDKLSGKFCRSILSALVIRLINRRQPSRAIRC